LPDVEFILSAFVAFKHIFMGMRHFDGVSLTDWKFIDVVLEVSVFVVIFEFASLQRL
jgi:hypothetical protein